MENSIWHISPALEQKIREQYVKAAPCLWKRMISEVQSGAHDNCFWLAGASSYLISLDSVRFMVDPVLRIPEVWGACRENLSHDLCGLSFILYTHDHRDHYQPEFDQALSDLSIVRVVPEYMVNLYVETGETIYVKPGDKLCLADCWITVLPGVHKDSAGNGPEAVQYLVEKNGRSLYFPGDVRNPSLKLITNIGVADCMFAHVFLGKSNAKNVPWPGWLEQFSAYIEATHAKKVFLGHLYEMTSESERLYTYMSTGAIMDVLAGLCPETDVAIPQIGRCYSL